MCGCSFGCPDNPISRDWLGYVDFDLRRRTSLPGLFGVHSGTKAAVTLAADFTSTMDAAIQYFNSIAFNFGGSIIVDWIGEVGATGCKPGRHALGRAIDITAIRFSNGSLMDMNVSWRPDRPVSEQRRYLAFLCAMRIHMSDVLGFHFDANHENHIHCDNNVLPTPPLRRNSPTDVRLVKLIANLQLGWNLPVMHSAATSGQWNQQAADGYTWVAAANRTQCHDAFGSTWGMIAFLDIVCKNAMSNNAAGFHRGGC